MDMRPISFYKIKEVLYNGKNSLIYSAFHETTLQNVVIKVLKNDYPSSQQIARFLHEYEIAKQLHAEIPDYVIEPYGLIKHHNSYALIFEDFGGTSLSKLLIQGPLSVTVFLDLAIRLTQIVKAIHSLHVIIKNINPSNIFWNPTSSRLKFADFGISTTLAFENIEPGSVFSIEGSLPYISPEQTGRMNRVVDYRCDYYSLGVTFYEMITGILPFKIKDPLEIVNAHLTKKPPEPHEIDPALPLVISNIIMKLLSKQPEERYQTTMGLLTDLSTCQNQWLEKRTIAPFLIGFKDVSSHFQVAEKLYGRQEQTRILHDAFHRIRNGKAELLLIEGEAGVGKSSLVYEIYKQVSNDEGNLISGKCDYYKQTVPYWPLAQALKKMIELILLENPEEIVQWRKAFLEALGPNGKMITDIVPNLKIIIGAQPEILELGVVENQNRFVYTFQSLIKVLADAKHPLIIFLDDLHWVDNSTVDLLSRLLKNPDLRHLLVIGSYRSKEGDSISIIPFDADHLKKKGVIVNQFILPNLEDAHLNQLLIDTLHTQPDKISNLTSYLMNKTKGNPFFIHQILNNLHKEGYITFDSSEGVWKWDIIKINSKEISDDLFKFMTGMILSLSPETQQLLSLAACLGYKFELKMLADLNGKSIEKTSQELWNAMEEGVVLADNEDYKFIGAEDESQARYRFFHDIVQQVVYQLIPQSKKNLIHYKIGKNELDYTTPYEISERIFEIVNHFNRASEILLQGKDKRQFCELNYEAGVLSKRLIAFKAAEYYFKTSLALLPPNYWEKEPDMAFKILIKYGVTLYINKDEKQSELIIKELLAHTNDPLVKADIYLTLEILYATKNKNEQNVQAGLQGLKCLGIDLPRNPSLLMFFQEWLLVKWHLKFRNVSDLVDLPRMKDHSLMTALKLLQEAESGAYFSGSKILYGIIILKQMNIVLRHGNTEGVALVYLGYAILLNFMGQLKEALQFGKLALALVDRYSDDRVYGRVISIYGVIIHGWSHHWKTLGHYFQESIRMGLQAGNSVTASIGCSYFLLFNPEKSLKEIVQESPPYLNLIKQFGHEDLWNSAKIQFQLRANLSGQTKDPLSLNCEDFNENESVAFMKKVNFQVGITIFHLSKMILFYYHRVFKRGLEELAMADREISILYGLIFYTTYTSFAFFLQAGTFHELNWVGQKKTWFNMQRQYRRMRRWASHCPINFLHIRYLMEAELARLNKQIKKAEKLYEQAVETAKKNQYLQYEALANELAFRFYIEQKNDKMAKIYFREAYRNYEAWGAQIKIDQLKADFPHLAPNKKNALLLSLSDSTSSHSSTKSLDFVAIANSSQSITREIKFANLIDQIIEIITYHLQAPRCVLILGDERSLSLQVVIEHHARQRIDLPLKSCVPLSLVQSVAASKTPIVLANALIDLRFKDDPYFKNHQPQSILCYPLVNLNILKGVFYLEHPSQSDYFNENHLNIMNLLSTQIAIALENASLYSQLEERVQERKKSLKDAQDKLIQKEKMAFMGVLAEGIAHEVKAPLNAVIQSSTSLLDSIRLLHSLLKTEDQKQIDPPLDVLKENISNILEQGIKADKTVNLMQEYSAKNPQEASLVDVHLMLKQASENMQKNRQDQYAELNLKIEYDFDYSLNYIKMVKTDMEKVFMHLLDNAYYAMQKKRQTAVDYAPVLKITTRDSKEGFIIKIKDNGIGIKPAEHPKIFTPFFTTRPPGQGIGLGLSYCSNVILEKHGGQISFESVFGEFTEFTIILPHGFAEENPS